MPADQAPPTLPVPAAVPATTPAQWFAERVGGFYALLTGQPVSLYAAAVQWIGYGLVYLLFLLREFPHRDEIWGPDSPWTPALARQLFEQTGWASILTLSDSRPTSRSATRPPSSPACCSRWDGAPEQCPWHSPSWSRRSTPGRSS